MKIASNLRNINQALNNLQAQIQVQDKTTSKLIKLSKDRNNFKEIHKTNSEEELKKMTNLVKSTKITHRRRLDSQEKNDRNNILDWLIIVNEKLSHHDSTYILAIDIIEKIMDLDEFDTNGLHLLSISSFFLASKYEEVIQIGLDQLTSKVGHKKFTREEIKKTEFFLLKKLSFSLPKNYFLDFTFSLIKNLSHKKNKDVHMNNTIKFLPMIYTPRQIKQNKSKKKISCISNNKSVSILEKNVNSKNTSNESSINSKRSSSLFYPNSQLENEFNNIIYLFCIYIYKMLRIEHDIISKLDNLHLYISIVYFAIEYLTDTLNIRGKINQCSLTLFAESNGISSESIKSTAETIKICYHNSKINNEKFKYLNSIYVVYFP